MLFEIRVWPFLINVAEPPDVMVSCMANLCAGENGDGGVKDDWDAFTAYLLDCADIWVEFGSPALCQAGIDPYGPGLCVIYGPTGPPRLIPALSVPTPGRPTLVAFDIPRSLRSDWVYANWLLWASMRAFIVPCGTGEFEISYACEGNSYSAATASKFRST